MWFVALEYIVSVLWSYIGCNRFIVDSWKICRATGLPLYPYIAAGWTGVILGCTCLLQFLVSMIIDSRYERYHENYWMVWYPLAYWMLNVVTTVCGFPKAFFKKKGKRSRMDESRSRVTEPRQLIIEDSPSVLRLKDRFAEVNYHAIFGFGTAVLVAAGI
ncbi:MAG: hypothetical protein R3E61_08600 [Pseudomonadales bacterium]